MKKNKNSQIQWEIYIFYKPQQNKISKIAVCYFMLKFFVSLNSLKKFDISSPSALYRWHKCVTGLLLSTALKTTISIFSPENGSGSNYIETNPCLALFGKTNILEMLWSGIFFTFSTISTLIPINKFLLILLFWNHSRNFFWKSIKWRWVWNSISRQVLINNNRIYPGFKYEANISIEFWTVRQTTKSQKMIKNQFFQNDLKFDLNEFRYRFQLQNGSKTPQGFISGHISILMIL